MADDNETLIDPNNDSDSDPNMMETQLTQADDGVAQTIVQGGAAEALPETIADVKIIRELGRGGMGVVYEGRQEYIDRRVAVKLLLSKALSDPQFVERFQREAKILAGLSHTNIVSCYQAGVCDDGNCFIVMEFIEGHDLEAHIKKHGALTEAQALGVLKKIAEALSYAHQNGVIHRDVKPENILLGSEACADLPFTPKLVDLGLARPDASANMQLTAQGVIMGTPATMAPEQFDDPDNVDQRADIYGLGCVLYQALCEVPAFSGSGLSQIMQAKLHEEAPDPRLINRAVSPAMALLVQDMLAKDRENRVQDYAELFKRIEQVAHAPAASSSASKVIPIIAALAIVLIAAVVVMALPTETTDADQSTSAAMNTDTVVEDTKPSQPTKLPPSELGLITSASPQDAWWQTDGGFWGAEEEGTGITGFSKDASGARINLSVKQTVKQLSCTIGAVLDEGKEHAFDKCTIQVSFADGAVWKVALNDLGGIITLHATPPKTSTAVEEASNVTAPHKWPLNIYSDAKGWHFQVAAFRQDLLKYDQDITQISFIVENGNIFIRDAVLNKGL